MKNNKSLGQHWLKNRIYLDQIADAAVFEGVGTCLEIGPGLGTLTSSLLKRFERVVAIEFDQNLAKNLPKSFPGKNLTVINEDILKFDLDSVKGDYSVAGNIPYYITSPIIEKLLTAEHPPRQISLLIQKEVAERVADERESVLSLFVKNQAEVQLGPIVGRLEFTPPPKVDSQVLILTPRPHPLIIPQAFKLVKIGFKNPRKKLISNLTSLKSKEELREIFTNLHLDENARPSDLHLDDWSRLYSLLMH